MANGAGNWVSYRVRYLAILLCLAAFGLVMHFQLFSKLRQTDLIGLLNTKDLQLTGWAFLGGALVLLLLIEVFVFRPMTRRMEQDLMDLELLHRDMEVVLEREQQKISQELHDSLGQQLTGISLHCQALASRMKKLKLPEAENAMRIAKFASDAINDARRLAHGLSPIFLETNGFNEAIEELVTYLNSADGISCRLQYDERLPTMDNLVAINLYRITQEALNNAIRHGHAKDVRISIGRRRDKYLLTISDNGCGLSPNARESGGMGMRIMNYRASKIGGSLEIGERQEGGTEVRVSFDASLPTDDRTES